MPKDHYRTLGISPQSGPDEIRKNYRTLVKRYHPDRHPDDRAVHAHFREIQEAYETLTDPILRDAWLQERWLLASQGLSTASQPLLTATDILKRLLIIERGFASEDPWRADRAIRIRRLTEHLNQEHLDILKQESDQLDAIAETLVRCGSHLDPDGLLVLSSQMKELLPETHPAFKSLMRLRSAKISEDRWARWKPFVLLTAALLGCLLIARLA
jgi:DnaJ-domain-containing protein 1